MFTQIRSKTIIILSFLALGQLNVLAETDEKLFSHLRRKMVKEQIVARGVKDQSVLSACLKVARHKFVPRQLQRFAYQDRPLAIGYEQTISQPYIVALMTELAGCSSKSRVLEIGTGSGYQAAILAEIAREVYTVEILKPLADNSRKRLKEMGYENIRVKCADGYQGWKEFTPYDAIVVTCAPDEVPEALIEQLRFGGRLVIPVGIFFQELKVFTKTESGLEEKSVIPVRFVPMIKSNSQ